MHTNAHIQNNVEHQSFLVHLYELMFYLTFCLNVSFLLFFFYKLVSLLLWSVTENSHPTHPKFIHYSFVISSIILSLNLNCKLWIWEKMFDLFQDPVPTLGSIWEGSTEGTGPHSKPVAPRPTNVGQWSEKKSLAYSPGKRPQEIFLCVRSYLAHAFLH
jgi:hypothetical protein